MIPGKLNMPAMLTAALLALQASAAAADRVEDRREWTERFPLTTAEPALEIHNIWGDVRVVSGGDGEITLSISEHRSAPSRELFDRSLEVYGLDIQADGERVEARVGERGRSWRRDPCRSCRVEYRFEVRAPVNTRLYASTVNDGGVEVTGIRGVVSASNVNGPVAIREAGACESVDSVNGDITLGFATAPRRGCRLETVNGDIRLQLPAGSGIDLAVDLGNGRMTSQLPVEPLAIPARVEHREKGGRRVYRIEQAAGVRLAGGGAVFSASSLNGDLHVQQTGKGILPRRTP